jgi:ketosteroid isomerase-like protein
MSPCERIVRRFFDAFMHGEVDRMLALVDPEAVFRPAAPMAGREELHGHAEIRGWARWATSRRPIMAARVDELRPLDEEHVVLEGRARIPDPDGGFVDRSTAWLVRVRGGKIIGFDGFRTADEALARHHEGVQP